MGGVEEGRVAVALLLRCPSGKTPDTPSIPSHKNIPLYRNSELRHKSKQPGPRRGAVRESFEARAGLRWTRQRRAREAKGRAGSPCEPVATCGRAAPKSGEASWRSRMSCVRQNRVVLTVVATVKPFAEMCASPTGQTASSIRGAREARRKVRLPGEHGISRPTIAQGRPGVRPHLYAAVQSFCAICAQRTVGAKPAPGLPCALVSPKSARMWQRAVGSEPPVAGTEPVAPKGDRAC